ncbi:MAG TPA: hypothetical protein VKT73_12930 [Xanthobacteraceae bacterium]|nr:hypothetical protein [Xanthobacteraceae bacterium]
MKYVGDNAPAPSRLTVPVSIDFACDCKNRITANFKLLPEMTLPMIVKCGMCDRRYEHSVDGKTIKPMPSNRLIGVRKRSF